jgi:hypothetical protein
MKLKEQINKQRAYAIKKMDEAGKNGDSAMYGYWKGIMLSMDWVQESKNKWAYIDSEVMPEDKGSAF